MNRFSTFRHLASAWIAVLGLMDNVYPQRVEVNWTNAGAGDWSTGSNWDSGFTPELDPGFGLFEVGVINNGGTAQVNSSQPTVGGVNLGVGPADVGMLTILSGGSITAAAGGDTGGNVQVGSQGQGTLIVESGGSLTSELLQVTGANGSLLQLQGGGSINVSGSVDLVRNVRITGPGSTFSVGGNLQVNRNFVAEVTSLTNHTPITVAGSNITLREDAEIQMAFTGVTPVAGNSWTLIDGSPSTLIQDRFTQVTGPALAGGLQYVQQFDLANNDVKVSIGGNLKLTVDRRTGAATVGNSSGADVSLQAYSIFSDSGFLEPAGWTSFEESGFDGGTWIDGQLGPRGGNANALAEAHSNPQSSSTISAGQTISIGSIIDNSGLPFGQSREDATFEYLDGSTLSFGEVEYVGLYNNLVLTVDPSTGAGRLSNQSPFDIDVSLYTITSNSGALQPDASQALGVGWDSFEEQGLDGGTWIRCAICEGSGSTEVLSEANTAGPVTLESGDSFDLGIIWDTTQEDLVLEFLNETGGATDLMEGIVEYASIVDGDFDFDGDIDGFDFLNWQRGLSPNSISPGDLNAWSANYGTGGGPLAGLSTVPEPSALILTAVGMYLPCCVRRRGNVTTPTC